MAANKAPEITRVYTTDGTANWGSVVIVCKDEYRGEYTVTLDRADRSTVLASGKKIGAFIGHGSPMGFQLDTMRNLVAGKTSGNPIPPTASAPAPKAQAVAPKAVPVNGNLDSAVADIVRIVLQSATVGTDPAELQGLRDEIAKLQGEIGTLREQVVASAPTQFVVNTVPTVQLQGVQHREFRKVLTMVAQGDNVYLCGPAGSGKSTIPEQIAEVLGLRFAAQSCGQTDAKFDYVGYRDGNGVLHGTLFRDMWENGGLFLLDEMDNASPDLLVTLNQALANGQMAFPDGMIRKHERFVCMGAGNTYGNGATAQFVGRSPQDGAFLNRFTKWVVNVDERVEDAMLGSIVMDSEVLANWKGIVRKARANAERHGLRVMVTPRDAMRGAKLLATGEFSYTEAVRSQWGFGMDESTWNKVHEGVAL